MVENSRDRKRRNPKEFTCEICTKIIKNSNYKKLIRFCSQECYQKSDSFKKAVFNGGKSHLGKKHWWGDKIAEAKRGKPRFDMRNEKHWGWRGDEVQYEALHSWVARNKKKPKECEHCHRSGLKLELANLSHTYKRNVDDFVYLCRWCHRTLDKGVVVNARQLLKGKTKKTA